MALLGAQANLSTTYTSRDTEHMGPPRGNPTSVEAGGDSKLYSTRVDVPAGAAASHLNNRGILSYSDTNYAASGTLPLIDGRIAGDVHGTNYGPISAIATTTFIDGDGGGTASRDTSAWVYTRGPSTKENIYDGGLF